MKITLEVPDTFSAMGVTMVYDYEAIGLKMYTSTITREDLGEDRTIKLPKEG